LTGETVQLAGMSSRPVLFTLCSLVLAATASAWDYEGHRIVNQIALASLPADFPAFVREPANAERISWLCSEPDRWRSSPDLPTRHCNGIDHYFDFIDKAVNAFGIGKVRSLLIVGLEPPEDTLEAVYQLARRGCDPVLSPFRPDPSTPLRSLPPPTAELLERIYLESLEIISPYPVKLGPRCIPCQHNTLTFSDGTDAYFHS
jgi:hypothetical protein